MHDRSAVLGELSLASAKYSEMIEVLDAMAEMNEIPGKLINWSLTKDTRGLRCDFRRIQNGRKI